MWLIWASMIFFIVVPASLLKGHPAYAFLVAISTLLAVFSPVWVTEIAEILKRKLNA